MQHRSRASRWALSPGYAEADAISTGMG